jgi:AmmeMemoRadiSam system radical SAM enzyme/AmmeMemoRadiSam system protein B/AmmeMemoRadiSam system protein A
MRRTITSPPDEPARPDGLRMGGWWHDAEDGRRIACDLCPRSCKLAPGDRGFCFVRQNLDGQMVSTTYGRSTGFCIDPIEKKPLFHFYPGTPVLSFGTAGCNLGCKFCQNWTSSKSREVDDYCEVADPESIAEAARQHGCRSVAFTYNDPVVWAEYAIDTARACRSRGVRTVAVTAGYITPRARPAFFEVMDAANVDLKGFTEDFYWKFSSGHLEPVRDTLRWLVRETDVWVEVTNLIIPQANDDRHDLKRMCDWVLEALGPDVPLHFSAFHPDFRLRDRGSTPAETLLAAREIAVGAGLRYVYTGNVRDRRHQSTYCSVCGRMVIERDGYDLGLYALDRGRCRHCGAPLAGRFDQAAGGWGARRQPIRIPALVSARPTPEGSLENENGPVAAEHSATKAPPPVPRPLPSDGEPRMIENRAEEAVPPAVQQPRLSEEQQQTVFRAAGRRVAAAVRGQPPQRLEEQLGAVAQVPVLGAFVTLKRGGQLRSCCGFLGHQVPLAEAVDHAAVRTAKDDPRFPPIAVDELGLLEMDVWLLWGMEQVPQRGRERIGAVEIGRHGLQISRGPARGLLLPGVAVEHKFSPEDFLRQVCLKAGLPSNAWLDDDTTLMRFQGLAIEGHLDPGPAPAEETVGGGPGPSEVSALADFCRQNLAALATGATPSYYLPGGFDGGVYGLAITVRFPERERQIGCSRLSAAAQIPLQATLFELVRTLSGALAAERIPAPVVSTARVALSVFWNPVRQGTLDRPRLEGFDPRRQALLATTPAYWSCAYDPQRAADDVLRQAVEAWGQSSSPCGDLYSLAVTTTEPRLSLSNVPPPQAGPAVRAPAVAGQFYPGDPQQIGALLDRFLAEKPVAEPWAGALVPHAGWIYSGSLATAVWARVRIPSRVIILAPKHHARGAEWAVAPHQVWRLPGADLASDPELAGRLAQAVAGLELDAAAHELEHSIEVQLPILARLAPATRVVGIVLHGGSQERLERFADQMAGVLRGLPERPLLVVSTDMNHYASDADTRRIDRAALDAIERLDPAGLLALVRQQRISMCGVLPAVVVMETLRRLGSLNRCQAVGYETSAAGSGDTARVVGYAGLLFG